MIELLPAKGRKEICCSVVTVCGEHRHLINILFCVNAIVIPFYNDYGDLRQELHKQNYDV